MVPRSHLQLLSNASGPPGSAGFKITGVAKDGVGLCRVWLRRKDPWDRYLDPRFHSDQWDVRCYTRVDSAFSLVEEFSPESLDDLGERFEFTVEAGALSRLSPNGDIVHDTVLSWAKSVTGAAADAPGSAPVAEPEPAREPSISVAELPLRSPEPARAEVPVPDDTPAAVGQSAPESALAATAESNKIGEEAAAALAAEPAPTSVPPTPDPLAAVSDAWDEIAEMAERATGIYPATPAPSDDE